MKSPDGLCEQDVPEERELQREARHCAELSEDYIQSPLLELQLQSTHGRPGRAAYTEDGTYKSWCWTRANPMHTGAIFSILGALVDTDEISTQKLKPETWDSKIAAAEKRLAKLVSGECKAPQQIAKKVKRIEREELRIDRLKQQRDSSKNIAAEIEIAQGGIDFLDVEIKRVDKELLRLASVEEDSKTADHARNTERATQELDGLMADRDVLKKKLRGLQDVARNNDWIDLFTFIDQMYPLDEAAGINTAIRVSLDSAAVEKYEEHDLDFEAVDVFKDGDLEQQPSVRIHYPDRSEPVPPVARSDPDLTDARAGGVSSGGEHSEDYWIGAGKEICTQIAGLKYFVAKVGHARQSMLLRLLGPGQD